MEKRDETQQEVLLDVNKEPITSIDVLVEHCHRALSAQLWTTCCWSRTAQAGKSAISTILSSPSRRTPIQPVRPFWSEPCERVLREVGSGEWCPGAIRYVGPAQRKALEARGYTLGGPARNYQKERVIDSAAAAEAAALEVLEIFFEVFGDLV